MVAEMVADMKVDMVGDINIDIDINMEIKFGESVGYGGFSARTYPACASSIMLCQFISKVGASKKRKFPFGRFLVRAEC